MSANLLSRFRCAKNPDYRYFGRGLLLGRSICPKYSWIKISRGSLVMIDAVQSDTEKVHKNGEKLVKQRRIEGIVKNKRLQVEEK